ncbi:MAG: metallophosphoesterase family protein [Planctomycetota bacterium]|nr:metallophosphoesterase family protein [Planctomycetota bacterium]
MERRNMAKVLLMLAIGGTHIHAANIAIEPYLQDMTGDSVKIVWWTNTQTTQNVVHIVNPVRTTASATSRQIDGVIFVRHVATVAELTPSTDYEYHVESDGVRSQPYRFRSAATRDEPFCFVYLGDGRNDDDQVMARHRAVYKAAMDLSPNLIIYGGDAVEYGAYNSHEKSWESFFRQVCTTTQGGLPAASTIGHYFVVGNHEIYDPAHDKYASGGLAGTSMARFQAFCINPDNGSSDPRWRSRYYAFTYGCATFIVLDLNNTSDDALDNHDKIPDGCSPDWEPGSEQYLWMIEQLETAQRTSAFTFIFTHPAPYSRGVHGTSDKAIDYQRGFELRSLDSVFRTYGVDAVFASHDHTVEHCLTGPEGYWEKMDVNDPANLNYLVQGNSGHSARDPHPQWKRWMQIPGAPPETFYTVWFYDWNKSNSPETVRCSLHDVQISKTSARTWQAKFQVISIDNLHKQRHHDDAFTIHRTDPTFSSMTTEHRQHALALEQEITPIPRDTSWPIAISIALAIGTFIALGTVGTRLWYRRRGRSTVHSGYM